MNDVQLTQLFSQSFFPRERRGSYLVGFGDSNNRKASLKENVGYSDYSGLYKKIPGLYKDDIFPGKINYSPEVKNTHMNNHIPGTLPGVNFTLQTPQSKITRVKFGKPRKMKDGSKVYFEKK